MEITTVRDKSGKFLADRATWFDMTEQKKTGETLRESEQKFRNFFESSNDAIFIADGETHKLVDCNKKAEKLIGRPKAQILSMRADELHPKDRVKETMEGFERQAQGKIAIIETEVLARSGKRIPVEVNAAAFAAGEKRYLVGIFRDITERKAAEQQLRESEGRYTKRLEDEVKVRTAELQQALKEKDEYLSTTTHELKTPLVPIKMQTELWLSGAYGTIDEKQRGSLGMVLKSTVRLARLIDDVLFVSKIEGANLKYYLKEVDLGAALRESVGESMEAMSRKRISLTGSIAAGKMMVNGDDMRLKQVFSNLISNAIKFTPEGGSVSVTSKVSGKNALVAITDTGIGMSEEYLSRVFGKFQQADQAITRKFGGTGLGLAICHGIVAQHKGRIWVESSVGKGTTVFVMLPLLQNKGKAEG